MKLLITCPVFGWEYSHLFLENQLKSLVDETNIPAALKQGHEISFIVYTDSASLGRIGSHPNLRRLAELVEVELSPTIKNNTFDGRYNALQEQLHSTIKEGLETNSFVSALVADLVFAQGFLPLVLSHLEKGHDSVFVLPMRGVSRLRDDDGMNVWLAKAKGALPAINLFQMTYEYLHPVWVFSDWDKNITRMPYTPQWNSSTGLLVRSFSITPIIFKPTTPMLRCEMIDRDLPSLCANPYWADDWTDAPVVGVEPIDCHYRVRKNVCNTAEDIGKWSKSHLHPSQINHTSHSLWYPNKTTVMGDKPADFWHESNKVVRKIREAHDRHETL